MKVRRIYEKEVKKFKEGDQIQVGKYTATCVLINGTEAMFLLDQYLDKRFDHLDLLRDINAYIKKDENFKEINKQVLPICKLSDGTDVKYRVPYAGEMFSGTIDDEWMRKAYAPDTKEGFLDIWPCMKDRKNRIADREGEPYELGWLMNSYKNSATTFAYVGSYGYAYYGDANYSYGVRPCFVLKKEK